MNNKKTVRNKKEIIATYKAVIVGEIYDKAYGDRDIVNIINLFNDIHGSSMKMKITRVEKMGKKEREPVSSRA